MRIALNAWFLDQPGTGSGQYLQGLLRALAALGVGHRILLVTPQGASSSQAPGQDIEILPVRSRLWRGNLGKLWFEQIAFPQACRRWRADLAHVPYWGSPLAPPVPTVVTIHDLIPLLLPAYRGGPLVRLYTSLVAAAAEQATLVLTDSLASKADIETHLRLPPERVHCVYLAAGEHLRAEPEPHDAAVQARYGLRGAGGAGPASRYLLYLAGHDIRKNVAALVEAFATVTAADADVLLAIGGRLPERARPPLYDPRPLVEALGLVQEVRFLGWVEEADKPALYRGAACAIFPSRYEGFGLPVLEALACGTPLVASSASSLPELQGDAGFSVHPDDLRAMAGAILACLVDEPLAAELRRRGPQQAARFRWDRTARETVAFYEQAAATAHRSAG